MNEYEIINVFVQKLESLGYPSDSIAIEYKIPKTSRYADIVIFDRYTNKIMMLFEIKISKEDSNKDRIKNYAKEQLEIYINNLDNPQLLAYVVIAKNINDFEIYPFNIDNDNGKRWITFK